VVSGTAKTIHAADFSPQLMTKEIERRLLTGRGSWDEGREKGEGEAPAKPNLSANREISKSASRETAAIGD